MWVSHGDSPTAEDWIVDGSILASVRKPPVVRFDGYTWWASILFEGRDMVVGYFPEQRAAKAAALAVLAEYSA